MSNKKSISHNMNARKEPSIIKLMNKFGMTGYGFFWGTIALIGSEGPVTIKKISEELHCDFEQTSKLIDFCVEQKLFTKTDNKISESFEQNVYKFC